MGFVANLFFFLTVQTFYTSRSQFTRQPSCQPTYEICNLM